MADDKTTGFETKIGEASTIGTLREILGPFVNDCVIRYENKGPIEVFYHIDRDKDAVIIFR